MYNRSVPKHYESQQGEIMKNALPDNFQFTFKTLDTIYTASHVPAFDKWVVTGGLNQGLSYTKFAIDALILEGTWKIVEPKKSLPSVFQFTTKTSEYTFTATYNAIKNKYLVTWPKQIYSGTAYTYKQMQANIQMGHWTIEENSLLKCENEGYDEGNTANVPPDEQCNVASIYDPVSFLMGAMNEGSTQECCEENAQVCTSLLDYLKEFTVNTGASVSIIEGSYTVLYNDVCYSADCDCELTEICDAVTTLYMADFN
jgi:hypothetical protein